jgi:hypothetical protein
MGKGEIYHFEYGHQTFGIGKFEREGICENEEQYIFYHCLRFFGCIAHDGYVTRFNVDHYVQKQRVISFRKATQSEIDRLKSEVVKNLFEW